MAELKQECAARGLDIKGNKGELITRLQAYLEEHGEPPRRTVSSHIYPGAPELGAQACQRFWLLRGHFLACLFLQLMLFLCLLALRICLVLIKPLNGKGLWVSQVSWFQNLDDGKKAPPSFENWKGTFCCVPDIMKKMFQWENGISTMVGFYGKVLT